MRHVLVPVILFCCATAGADDSALTRQLDESDLDVAARLFSQTMENGDREDWDELHRYFMHDPARYSQILERVDHLPWKDSQGRRIRSSERVINFNGSHYRFIHCLNRREFGEYVDAYLSRKRPSMESLIAMIESDGSIVQGENGDDGHYDGERRLAMAVIERRFPELHASYDRLTRYRYNTDIEREIERIVSHLRSHDKAPSEPNDQPKLR